MARLLRLDAFIAVSIPTIDQENRLSKLLLRQGIVYSEGMAWESR